MQLTNLNPGDDIGASAWLLRIDGHEILLDAGMHPRREGRAALPLFDHASANDVDAIALSHCHHDHCGSLPVALRHFPRARVYLPAPSYYLIDRVLHNSVSVMTRQRAELGIAEYPLYRHRELDMMAQLYQGIRFRREVEWAIPTRSRSGPLPTLEFFDAGHVLGSAGILVRGASQGLFFTGDVCFSPQTLMAGARFEDARADVLLMETTRGATPTPEGYSRSAEEARLVAAINATIARDAAVLLPAFALGRTQELLGLLALAMHEGRMPRRPVYLSGLGRVFTEIHDIEAPRIERQHPQLILHEALAMNVFEDGQAERIELAGGKLFVASAGMMSEHTAAHELARRMVGDERQSVFFVGYADADTPGGRLKASQTGTPFFFSKGAGPLTRQCQLESFDLTAHAQRQELVDFAVRLNPRVIVLAHGDPPARQWMAGALAERLPRTRIVSPGPGQSVEI